MMSIKQLVVLIIFLIFYQYVEAAGESKFSFEPIMGVETAMVRFPEPSKYVTRATYGVRVLYGVTALSAEAEGTEAQSRKDYPSIDQKVEDKSQRVSLGIRSTLPIGNFIGFYARLGGRASQGETKVTTSGIVETHNNPLRVDPYAGAGVQVALASNFALNAGVTMIRNEDNKFDKQYTLGLTARIGSL